MYSVFIMAFGLFCFLDNVDTKAAMGYFDGGDQTLVINLWYRSVRESTF